MEKSQQDALIGLVLGNRFKILKLIGRGGMANVYQGIDQENQSIVALKILKAEYVQDREFAQRFDAEAKAAASLDHPNIVKVYGVGEHKGIRYIVMQYIEGNTLKEVIDARGKLDWPLALSLSIQVAQALQEAHLNGIIHRDIKPHNIMVTRTQQALVTDFGIARAQNNEMITLTGASALGSVHYFSPEQARGGRIEAGADIYSWGIMFYEMLTGDLPFDGDSSISVAIMHLQKEATAPHLLQPSIPLGLSKIIMKCLRKNPKERYMSVEELIKELLDFRKNPEGTYGQVFPVAEEAAEPFSFATLNYQNINNFDKVKNLEQSIYERKHKRRREILAGLFLVLLCMLALVVGSSYLLNAFSNGNLGEANQEASVPILSNYVDRKIEEVTKELEAQQISYKLVKRKVEKEKVGLVLEQNLPVNTKMTSLQRNPLILTVGEERKALLVPALEKKTLEEAQALLDGLGISFQIQTEYSEEIKENLIIRTTPEKNQEIYENQSLIVYLSKGEEKVTIPRLQGLRLDEAKAKIEEAGLQVGLIEDKRPSELFTAYVREASVAEGEQVAKNTKIDLVIDSSSLETGS